jgi:hypothetical protein
MRLRIVLALLWLPLATAVTPARVADQPRMWDVVQAPDWALTVRSVERRSEPLPAVDGAQPARPDGHWALFVVDLTNRTSRSLAPEAGDFVLWSTEGGPAANLAASTLGRVYAATAGLTPFGEAVPPGATATTLVLFDIDVSASRLTLDFLPAGTTIQIDECKCDLPSPVRELDGGLA